jgi:hypothetical protein
MRIVYYSAWRLGFAVAAGLAMFLMSFGMFDSSRGKTQFAGLLFLIIGPLLAGGAAKALLGDRVALRISRDMLQISTLWRRRVVDWDEITGVGFKLVGSYGLFGLFKLFSSRQLEITVKGGLFGGKTLTLSRLFLDLKDDEYYALPETMMAVRDGELGDRPGAQPAAVAVRRAELPYPTPVHEASFDPDAALARYQARKAGGELEEWIPQGAMLNGQPISQAGGMPQTASRGFGRKGL